MKAKQIEKLLTGVMNNFLESINDPDIRNIIKERSYITGGSISCMLIDEYVNDYDIYFYNKEDADKVKTYFETKILKTSSDDKFKVKLITDNAINLSDKIQLIIKFVGEPKEVTDKFDFKHIKSYYDCNTQKLHLTNDVYQLVCEKELVYTGSEYPLSSLFRLKKYIKKGWNVSTTTMLHIALDIVSVFNKMEKGRMRPCGIDDQDIIEPQKDTKFIIDDEIDFNEDEVFNVEDVINQLNGVDPFTIQAELSQKIGQYLTVDQIIKIINKE